MIFNLKKGKYLIMSATYCYFVGNKSISIGRFVKLYFPYKSIIDIARQAEHAKNN